MPGAASSLLPLDHLLHKQQMLICLSGSCCQRKEGGGREEGKERGGGRGRSGSCSPCWNGRCFRLVLGPIILPNSRSQQMQQSLSQMRGREVLSIKYKFSITCLINTAGFAGSRLAFYKHGSWQAFFCWR